MFWPFWKTGKRWAGRGTVYPPDLLLLVHSLSSSQVIKMKNRNNKPLGLIVTPFPYDGVPWFKIQRSSPRDCKQSETRKLGKMRTWEVEHHIWTMLGDLHCRLKLGLCLGSCWQVFTSDSIFLSCGGPFITSMFLALPYPFTHPSQEGLGDIAEWWLWDKELNCVAQFLPLFGTGLPAKTPILLCSHILYIEQSLPWLGPYTQSLLPVTGWAVHLVLGFGIRKLIITSHFTHLPIQPFWVLVTLGYYNKLS